MIQYIECKNCGWVGHEAAFNWKPIPSRSGDYRQVCPKCGLPDRAYNFLSKKFLFSA